jgi:hypothetical protein
MNKDSITVHAFSPTVQCQDQPSESDSDAAREDAFLLSRGRSILHAGCHTIGWQTPNARELEDCAHHSAFHRVQLTKIYSTLRFSQQCVHLSARTTGPGCRCPRDWYHEGVGYSSLSIREVLYCRSGAFQERVVLLRTLSAPCRSEGGSQSTPIEQFYSEPASDKAQEGRGRHGTARRAHNPGTRSI